MEDHPTSEFETELPLFLVVDSSLPHEHPLQFVADFLYIFIHSRHVKESSDSVLPQLVSIMADEANTLV